VLSRSLNAADEVMQAAIRRNLDAHYDVGADFNGDYLAPTCAHSGTHVG